MYREIELEDMELLTQEEAEDNMQFLASMKDEFFIQDPAFSPEDLDDHVTTVYDGDFDSGNVTWKYPVITIIHFKDDKLEPGTPLQYGNFDFVTAKDGQSAISIHPIIDEAPFNTVPDNRYEQSSIKRRLTSMFNSFGSIAITID